MDTNETNNGAQEERRRAPRTSSILATVFGIFMIFVYVGMGILLFINFFQWDPSFDWMRWVGGSLLILYGIWRGIRQAKGIDSRM